MPPRNTGVPRGHECHGRSVPPSRTGSLHGTRRITSVHFPNPFRSDRGFLVVEFLTDYVPLWLAIVVAAAIAAGVLMAFIGMLAFLFIWAERKVSGRIQDRLGPTRVGPFGLLQSLADGIKLIIEGRHRPGRRRQVPVPARPVPRVLRVVRRVPRPAVRQRPRRPRPERRRVLHARGAVQRGVRRRARRVRLRRASGRCSAACARRRRWSATRCRGRCAWSCRSASPAR